VSWREQAQCVGADANRFFPEPWDQLSRLDAIEYCQRCPVQIECRTEAVNLEAIQGWQIQGIWGGMSRQGRLRWAREQGITK
jgi:hypothetical protein